MMAYFPGASMLFLALCVSVSSGRMTYEGRYTREVGADYELVYPQRAHADGSFASYSLAQFYDWPASSGTYRGRRLDSSAAQRVHYLLMVGSDLYLLDLEPNTVFMAPAMVVETARGARLEDTVLAAPSGRQCHYTGSARGHHHVRAALSLCDGMVGYVRSPQGTLHFIEPVSDAAPEEDGRLKHIVYRSTRDIARLSGRGFCGVQGDWKEAWSKRFEYELSVNPRYAGKRQAAGQDNGARYVEVVVVVDKRFMDFHRQGKRDPEQYILTIMNMVSDFYHDESIGHLINVNVVRIVYLDKEYEEFDVLISPDATKSLRSFCEWQFKINPNTDHPNHHDMGVLITKYDICSQDSGNDTCNLLGLANVAQACNPHRSCCINEDSGLALGITISHEMGHVLGINHDSQPPITCPAQDPATGANYVMSPTVSGNTNSWSSCSREQITRFFEYGLGDCLLDQPADHNWNFPTMPVGAMYNADQQCALKYRTETKACDFGVNSFCEKLWCRVDRSCWTSGGPPMDGTPCANNKWCYHKKCVPTGTRATAVNGGWGEWGPLSECSRTCGGGIAKMERDCNNPPPANRGKYCIGERRRYQVCNTQACPSDQPTFYETQCTEQNNVSFSGQLHTWKPYRINAAEKPCALVCINEKRIYSTLSPRVKDGTPCKTGTRNRCVAGVCRTVGCDWVLDSKTIDDNCGVCAGDGSSCTLVEKLYNATRGSGYVKVAIIPKGSTNVHIAEKAASYNIISVASEAGKYFLNEKYHEDQNGEYDFGGVAGVYNHPVKDKEDLVIKGPTTINLVLYYVWFGRYPNPGLSYSYYVPATPTVPLARVPRPTVDIKPTVVSRTPRPAADVSPITKYSWEILEWGDCSVICGAGTQEANPVCVEESSGKVDDRFCEGMTKPASTSRVCNPRDCKVRWRVGPWRRCCRVRGNRGYQMRTLACLQEPQRIGGEEVSVSERMCKEARPRTLRQCRNPRFCTRFRRHAKVASEVAQERYPIFSIPAKNSLYINRRSSKDIKQMDTGVGYDYTEVDYNENSPFWRDVDDFYQVMLQRRPASKTGAKRRNHRGHYTYKSHGPWEEAGSYDDDIRGGGLPLLPKLPRELWNGGDDSWHEYEEADVQQLLRGDDMSWDEDSHASDRQGPAQNDGVLCIEDLDSIASEEQWRESPSRGGRAPQAQRGSNETTVILDRAPPPFLMEVPLVQKDHELWLSERTKEDMGDKVPEIGHAETLVPDSSRARNFTDDEAIRKLEELRPPAA